MWDLIPGGVGLGRRRTGFYTLTFMAIIIYYTVHFGGLLGLYSCKPLI
jgi:hypothetical protein